MKGESIFQRMTDLALRNDCVNLGQGFPDYEYSRDIIAKAARQVTHESNQYPPITGMPELQEAVSRHEAKWRGIHTSPEQNITVTTGATEAFLSTSIALLNPGDTVIVLEPAYDMYSAVLEKIGCLLKLVKLKEKTWALDLEALDQAASKSVKAIIVNTPHNPTGRVFSREEISFIASLCIRHDIIAICDEVYEHHIYDSFEHLSLASIDGMQDRCIRITSIGKIWLLTGWKVGYIVACENFTKKIRDVHQYTVFSTPPFLQRACAYALGKPSKDYEALRLHLMLKRNLLMSELIRIGIRPCECEGTFFVLARIPIHWDTDMDAAVALANKNGVASIPLSAFYNQGSFSTTEHYLRFSFCKSDSTILEGTRRLGKVLNNFGLSTCVNKASH